MEESNEDSDSGKLISDGELDEWEVENQCPEVQNGDSKKSEHIDKMD